MKLYIADLFCGGGGTSTGMIAALEARGIDYELVGVNHWDTAIATNKLNHKGNYERDGVERVSPRALVPGGRLHILWASPECTNHSRAKSGRPKDEQSRATAWDVLKWPQELYVDRIYVENVQEFLEWGPLDEKGNVIVAKKGEIFRQYIRTLKSFGYKVDWQLMNAADFGAPTCRRRLIIQAVRGRQKICWPTPTHAQTPGLFGEKQWVPARNIIDWSLRGESIFDRKRPLAVNTLRRCYAGFAKNGGNYSVEFAQLLRREIVRSATFYGKCPFDTLAALPEVKRTGQPHAPFITIMRGTSASQDMASVKTITEPLASISTIQHEVVINPFISRFNGGDNRNHQISYPVPVIDCSNRYALVEPFVFALGQTSGGARATGINEPISTIVTKAEHCLVSAVSNPCEPMFVTLRGTDDAHIQSSAQPVAKTIGTITTAGKQHGLIEPIVIDMAHPGDTSPQRVKSCSEMIPTITTRNNMAIAEPMILPHKFNNQPKSVASPLDAITTVNDFSLVESFIVPFFGEAGQQTPRTHSIGVPLPTVTGHGAGGVVVPALFVPQHGGGSVKSVNHPLSTIATTGSISIVEPFLIKFYGGAWRACSVNAPVDTITTKDRFGLTTGRLVADDWGNFLYLDILFRMLQPHELAAAMSFPPDYKFAGNKTDVVKQIGNAVCPKLAEALIAAALPGLIITIKNVA